jgi:mono/diheme cytochrome c family protein
MTGRRPSMLVLATSMAVVLTVEAPAHSAPAASPAETYAGASRQTGNLLPNGPSLPPTPELLAYGKWMFQGLCVRCHGISGDGDGADWKLTDHDPVHWLPHKPRNFTDPVFKLRSTRSGSMPIDADLFESISRGLVADKDMPSFKFLPERDRWALIAYLKSLSQRWTEEPPGKPIEIGEPPVPDTQTLLAGKAVYSRMKCATCHGEGGKGDGPSAYNLKDDDGLKIFPRDFTNPAEFVGPSDPRGVYRTFTSGLDGTPMPSFAASLNETERWQLVWYVLSLRPGWTVGEAQRELKHANTQGDQ